MLTKINPLLSKVQETIPTATLEQIEDILNTIGSNPEAVLSKPGKLQSFLNLVKAAQPGELATVETPDPIVPAPIEVPKTAPIVSANGGDRDWATFDTNKLDTLSFGELESYDEWQSKEEKRIALLNRIRGNQAKAISAKETALKSQLNIAETSRRVLQTQAQVEYAQTQGAELDELAVSVGTATMADQFDREKSALNDLGKLGKETPTLGQVALLQAQVIQHDRLNMAANIQNSIAPLVKAIGASTEKSAAQTIDV